MVRKQDFYTPNQGVSVIFRSKSARIKENHAGSEKIGESPDLGLAEMPINSKKTITVESFHGIRMSAIRKFVDHQDEYLAVTAKTALLQMGQRNMVPKLLETIKTSKNPTVRYNAIHYLYFGKKLVFTKKEFKILKQLSRDSDESISRVSNFILKEQSKIKQ